MAEPNTPYLRRLRCDATPELAKAFDAYRQKQGHKSEMAAVETLVREGLQRHGQLPGPKQ